MSEHLEGDTPARIPRSEMMTKAAPANGLCHAVAECWALGEEAAKAMTRISSMKENARKIGGVMP